MLSAGKSKQISYVTFSLESVILLFSLMKKVTKKSRQISRRAGLRWICQGSRTIARTIGQKLCAI
jgi:hypothetical protein